LLVTSQKIGIEVDADKLRMYSSNVNGCRRGLQRAGQVTTL